MTTYRHIIKTTITAIAVICFYACTDNLEEIAQMNAVSNEPIGEVENLLLKHTDSGLLKVTLSGKLMLDYSNDAFPYTEFPEGLKVVVYDSSKEPADQTTITSDYGIVYTETNLVNLEGNVKILTTDGNTFYGEQLYWDQNAKWIFTDQPFRTELSNSSKTSGNILDSSQEFGIKAVVRDASDLYYVKPTDE